MKGEGVIASSTAVGQSELTALSPGLCVWRMHSY